MNLQNGYKVIYEKAADGKRTFYASKNGTFADAEQLGEAIEIGKYKLIYEKNGKIYCSEASVPTFDENGEPTDTAVEAFDEVFFESKEPAQDFVTGVVTPQDPHTDAIATNGDSHGKLAVNDNVVTLNATGTIDRKKSAWGTYGNWVGFKIKVPEGVDAATAIYTRPNGTSSALSEVLDAGKNYASVYSDMAKYGNTATYYLDWNGDGVNDLTVVIDVSKATLVVEEPATEA